jgi:hypothetical protein
MRKATLVAGLVLAVSALSGCGGNGNNATNSGPTDTEAYCQKLKDDRTYFSAFSGGNIKPDQFNQALDRFHALADAAPTSIAQQWDLLDSTLTEVERTLAEAGIDAKDLAGMQNGKLPKGVDMMKLASLAKKLQALNSPELKAAAKKIQQHAKTACGLDLAATKG